VAVGVRFVAAAAASCHCVAAAGTAVWNGHERVWSLGRWFASPPLFLLLLRVLLLC
jgi:hypothetical protein